MDISEWQNREMFCFDRNGFRPHTTMKSLRTFGTNYIYFTPLFWILPPTCSKVRIELLK